MAEVMTVARPYAEAVFRSAIANNTLSIWSDMLKVLAKVSENERVKRLVNDPVIATKKMEEMLLGVLDDAVNDEGRNLILLLVENNRIGVLPQISTLFEQLKANHEGVLEARITSAFSMDDLQKNNLVANLEQKFKRKIEAKVSVDPELIGGVKVEIGDEVLDTSVRGKLEKMAVALKS